MSLPAAPASKPSSTARTAPRGRGASGMAAAEAHLGNPRPLLALHLVLVLVGHVGMAMMPLFAAAPAVAKAAPET